METRLLSPPDTPLCPSSRINVLAVLLRPSEASAYQKLLMKRVGDNLALWLHRRFLSLNLIMHFSRKHSAVPSEANQHIPELWRMLEEKLGTEKLKCVLSKVAQERPPLLHHLVNHLARVCDLNFDFTASFLGSILTAVWQDNSILTRLLGLHREMDPHRGRISLISALTGSSGASKPFTPLLMHLVPLPKKRKLELLYNEH